MENVSWSVKRLFMAEVENEAEDDYDLDGGDTPATLSTAQDSLTQGYEPFDDFDEEAVSAEVAGLIATHGPAALLDDFLTDADWDRRSQCDTTQADPVEED